MNPAEYMDLDVRKVRAAQEILCSLSTGGPLLVYVVDGLTGSSFDPDRVFDVDAYSVLGDETLP